MKSTFCKISGGESRSLDSPVAGPQAAGSLLDVDGSAQSTTRIARSWSATSPPFDSPSRPLWRRATASSSCKPSTTSPARGRSTCANRGSGRRSPTTTSPRPTPPLCGCLTASGPSASHRPRSRPHKPPSLPTIPRGWRVRNLQTRHSLDHVTLLCRRLSVPGQDRPCRSRLPTLARSWTRSYPWRDRPGRTLGATLTRSACVTTRTLRRRGRSTWGSARQRTKGRGRVTGRVAPMGGRSGGPGRRATRRSRKGTRPPQSSAIYQPSARCDPLLPHQLPRSSLPWPISCTISPSLLLLDRLPLIASLFLYSLVTRSDLPSRGTRTAWARHGPRRVPRPAP